jgi:murein L,D-transpeptidase YcbB/YkuD
VVLPPLLWQPRDAQDLLAFIQQIGSDGLDPADYDPAGLVAALRSGNPMLLSQAASERFNLVSNDLALGHVPRKQRDGWHIADEDLDRERQYALMKFALMQHRVPSTLRELLPTHPQYRDLKNALAATLPADVAQANRIRLNMDRWRWLPRDLGQKYIIVNVPAFYVSLVEDGTTKWRQRAVAGAIKTPTPMLSVMATGVSLNPWWEVPKSIEGEVRGKRGFVPLKGKDGKIQRWRQPPGPSNALGELKFVMYNPHNIYLHDTNARSRFNSQIRSLSHGCIRTQNVVDLAKTIFADEANPDWTAEKIDAVLASRKNVQANFAAPIPVYIVYFSAAASTEGRIVNYGDVYKRDAKVLAALLDKNGGGPASAASR